jgi:putative transcriptional regulator
MNEELFNELVASVREGGAILRGETAPSRKFVFEASDVRAERANLNLTQTSHQVLHDSTETTYE